ncbi:Hpt domain-containing protein [Tranquillimonas rosea]|uniref:Hpt domain-containing protein n=1 Tax=Tranquillimonas rosea TaxID=641238 RepID=UPI003BA872B5
MNRASSQAQFDGQVSAIRDQFLAGLPDRILEMEALCVALRRAPDRRRIDQLGMHLHKIAGIAGSLGYARLGETARRADATVSQAPAEASAAALWHEIEAQVEQCLDDMEDALDALDRSA